MDTDEGTQAIGQRTREVEADLARIWSGVLGIPAGSIDAKANFFSLGGDSVLIARVADQVASLYFSDRPDEAPGIAEYFSYGTLRSLAGRLVPTLRGTSASSGLTA